MKFSRYNICHRRGDSVIVLNTLSGSIISFAKSLFSLLSKGKVVPRDLKPQLIANKILANDDVEFKKIVKKRKCTNTSCSQTASVTVYTTLDCNFSCSYCFQVHKSSIMDSQTVEAVKNYLCELYKIYDEISITWIGGEPLLTIDVIEDISRHLQTKNVNFKAKIITNGFLLNELMMSRLCKCNITSIQVTFDGMPSTHNNKRRSHESTETFDIILNNVSNALHNFSDISFNIYINIDSDNIHEFIPLHKYISSFLKEGNYMIIPNFIENFSQTQCNNVVSDNDRFNFLVDLHDKHAIKAVDFAIEYEPTACMACNANSIAVAYNGDIYKCTTLVGNKKYVVGNIKNKLPLANLPTYSFAKTVRERCLSCPYFPLCDGGCPLLNNRLKCKIMHESVTRALIAAVDGFE